MKTADQIGWLVKDVITTLIPTSGKRKREFMNLVREKVDYYKNKIEKRYGIDLGEVKVKESGEFVGDWIYSLASIEGARNAWKNGRMPTNWDYSLSFMEASRIEPIRKLQFLAYSTFGDGVELAHYNNTIYVPFYYQNRIGDRDFKTRIKNLDYAVVHELGHTFWNKLADGVEHGKKDMLYEGFATYCAEDLFVDFYPFEYERSFKLQPMYINGRSKVKELVEKHGYGILTEIPKRWKEFSNINNGGI